ncbi:hypothetical protein LshimejAT787_0904390 [Lyophyllum shimeji]|uniref:RING-type domain-containing protein n=1 Tax=Lyophyllum shimeji TaxID=47721 RepID=A0A9P3PTE1_LYOSH|nr:hypothetical protein LshimejAT787_0904390 [Lyophyllum shimeji]
MSSHCPPQLHLELPPNTTSFKRSFDQFGFDLESPLGGSDGAGTSGSDGNDRNKRARSSSTFSDDSVSIGSSQSSTFASSSSSSSSSEHDLTSGTQLALAATRPATTLGAPLLSLHIPRASLEPPRLPTPEIRDIDMADYPMGETEEQAPTTSTPTGESQADESYRLSLERFNAFDAQISALRRPRSPVQLARSLTPPPVLPPLELLGEEAEISTNTISFLQPPAQPSPPLPDSLYRSEPPRSERADGNGHQPPWPYWPPGADLESGDSEDEVEPDTLSQPAAIRPDSPVPAIGELRSPSPLFDDLDELQPSASPRRASESTNPPTLPPIQDHEETGEDPLETLRMFAWNDSRPDSSTRTSQPPSLSRISIPRDPPSPRDRAEESRSSGSNVASSSPDNNAQSHIHPSPFARDLGGWLEDDSGSSWFGPSGREEPRSSQITRSANTNPSSGNNGTVLDSFAASRLEALHGIGEALQGIGRVLQESEMSLRPFLMEASTTSENGGPSSRRPSFRASSSTSARTSAWRSTSGSANRAENGQDDHDSSAVPRWLRLSAPSLPSPLENHMRPWLAERRSHDESPPPRIEPLATFDEFRDFYARYTPADRTSLTPHEENYNPILTHLPSGAADADPPGRTEAAAPSSRSDRQREASPPRSPVRPLPRVSGSSWSWPENTTIEVREYSTPDVITSTVHHPIREYPESLRHDAATTSHRDLAIGSASGTVDDRSPTLLRRPRYPGHLSNRSMDARSTTAEPSSSSSATTTSYAAPSTLLRLRSRPYVSHSSTHVHSHSHSMSSAHDDDPPSTFAESALDARRRIARLGLIQMQRQARVRTPPLATEPAAPAWIPFPLEAHPSQLPHRPRRASPPPRVTSLSQLIAEDRAARLRSSFERPPAPDRPTSLSSTVSSSLFDVAVGLDGERGRTSRPNNMRTETEPPGRFHRPLARIERRSFDRFGQLGSTTPAGGPQAVDGDLRRPYRSVLFRDFGASRLGQGQPEGSPSSGREFLPIPSLPSPDLDGVFDFTSSSSHSSADRDPEPGPPSRLSGRAASFSLRRSPSPPSPREGLRQQHVSPTGRGPFARPVRRDINPDSFAPGPFRNTIQRYYEATLAREREREDHTGGSQASQPYIQPRRTYVPPVIPPLPFEEDFSMGSLDRQERMSDAQLQALLERYPPTPSTTINSTRSEDTTPSFDRGRSWLFDDDTEHRHRPISRPATRNPEASSRPADLHNFLSRHPRMEASRLDNSENPRQQPSRGDEDGFSHALEVLRHDGLSIPRSQELITRYHRERQRTFTTPASPWGIIDEGSGPSRRASNESTTANEPPAPRQWRRRHIDPFSFETGDEDADEAARLADRARFLRARRFRSREFELSPVFPDGVRGFMRLGVGRRGGRPLGDYVRDEDFDESYESLLSLAAALGEAKPRCTPDSVIAQLETGLYKDWKTADSDHRCPICLDDYQPDDGLLKLADCSHWLHRECLQQWLRSASTCPVCRKPVVASSTSTRAGNDDSSNSNEAGPSRQRGGPRNESAGGSGYAPSDGNSSSDGPRPGIGEWMPPWRYGPGA